MATATTAPTYREAFEDDPTRYGVASPTLDDLHAYADRLTRARHRLEDEVRTARTRLGWHAHERAARRVIGAGHVHALRIAGVMNADDLPDIDDGTLIERRRAQLAALDALASFTDAAISAAATREVAARTAQL